ncbi:MAG: hypothetical protein OEZ01_03635 [Candidatus Heimdallarchaeota archaeon]|nr:hypothetical protein [Candidatus Heimdallarchaeota archaeon]MDH5645070.1 hypothetical protein [Candidatus Heimdallarchaeota archaeon]
MPYIHFTSIGPEIPNAKPQPIFRVDRKYPASFFHLILSKEDNNPKENDVENNLKEIIKTLETTGIGYQVHYLRVEEFWQNVATLAEMIARINSEYDIILNFSAGRRVFISTMVLAGSLIKGWQPEKNILCVQTSDAYEVTFEPNLPMIPDNDDRVILSKINNFEEELKSNSNAKLTTDDIGDVLKKGQSTISTRIKKLIQADYMEIKGHTKNLQPKGKAIVNVMNNLANDGIDPFNQEKIMKKRETNKQHWKRRKNKKQE